MPTIKLTQLAVEKLKPPTGKRIVYWDEYVGGFGLRVSSSGAKSWIAFGRVNRKPVMATLGSLALIPKVDTARDLAREALLSMKRGSSPVVARRAREQEAAAAETNTFKAVAAAYVEYRRAKTKMKPAGVKELARLLRVDVLPHWGNRDIATITKKDIKKLYDGIVDRGAPVQANRVLSRLKTMFTWVVYEDYIATSPAASVKRVFDEGEGRDRVLTDEEIVAFWNGCDSLGWPFGPLLKLLLLTGQRRTEVAEMSWGEIDLETATWTLPKERAKNDKSHLVHLSKSAVEILTGLPRTKSPQKFVFTINGRNAIRSFSKPKSRLNQLMGVSDWVIHDIRRTATTIMAERLKVAPHVADKILNHTAGTIKGVAAIYNRSAYLDERKDALEKLGHFIGNLIDPQPAKVVHLHGAA